MIIEKGKVEGHFTFSSFDFLVAPSHPGKHLRRDQGSRQAEQDQAEGKWLNDIHALYQLAFFDSYWNVSTNHVFSAEYFILGNPKDDVNIDIGWKFYIFSAEVLQIGVIVSS